MFVLMSTITTSELLDVLVLKVSRFKCSFTKTFNSDLYDNSTIRKYLFELEYRKTHHNKDEVSMG